MSYAVGERTVERTEPCAGSRDADGAGMLTEELTHPASRVAQGREVGMGGGRGSLRFPLLPASDAPGLRGTRQTLSIEKQIILQSD